jgi:hypothetical protein
MPERPMIAIIVGLTTGAAIGYRYFMGGFFFLQFDMHMFLNI